LPRPGRLRSHWSHDRDGIGRPSATKPSDMTLVPPKALIIMPLRATLAALGRQHLASNTRETKIPRLKSGSVASQGRMHLTGKAVRRLTESGRKSGWRRCISESLCSWARWDARCMLRRCGVTRSGGHLRSRRGNASGFRSDVRLNSGEMLSTRQLQRALRPSTRTCAYFEP
jgi:hypothetical protein